MSQLLLRKRFLCAGASPSSAQQPQGKVRRLHGAWMEPVTTDPGLIPAAGPAAGVAGVASSCLGPGQTHSQCLLRGERREK